MTTDPHISPLMLDAHAIGALDVDVAAKVRAHLATCARCADDDKQAAELRDEFMRSVLQRAPRPRRRTPLWVWFAVPAIAVCVLVIGLWQRPDHGIAAVGEDSDIAIKGDASWQVFANRDGQTFAVRDHTELAAGDRIRFVVLPGGARYLLIASVDGDRGVTVYYPYHGERSAAIDGVRFELAGSIVLDDASGPERIFAILSDTPVNAEIVTAALHDIATGGANAIRATRTVPLKVRAQLSVVFEKAQR